VILLLIAGGALIVIAFVVGIVTIRMLNKLPSDVPAVTVKVGKQPTREIVLKDGRANPENPDMFKDCEQCPEMVIVPAGTFLMGSTKDTDPDRDDDEDDGAGHQIEVTIPEPFAVGRFEVTFDEWATCVADRGCANNKTPTDYGFGKGRRPVIDVSWNDAQDYVKWINRKAPSGTSYALLSEAQWEYAARAGTVSAHWWGKDWDASKANGASSFESGKTSPVDHYPPNPWGLRDMIGNVWEWVADCYHDSYKNMPAGVKATGEEWRDPGGDCTSGVRALRGGSWYGEPRDLRSASRNDDLADDRDGDGGFRLSRTL
jgi:formylglycine-generating enzyme required for sulfatase activity